jgi:DNA-binding NarL/FixJ family response regulator
MKTMSDSGRERLNSGIVPTLIVESREVIAVGLERILQLNGIAVTGIAKGGGDAIHMAAATRPSVVLLGLNLPDMSPVRAGKQILRQTGQVRVLALTHGEANAEAGRLLLAGFDGHVSVEAGGAEIARAIKRIASGDEGMARLRSEESSFNGSDQLTKRELEVLGLLAIGLRNDQIAERLFLSPHTVRTHVQNIRMKLRVRSRLEAVLMAIRWGLAEPGEAQSA